MSCPIPKPGSKGAPIVDGNRMVRIEIVVTWFRLQVTRLEEAEICNVQECSRDQ
jgi:hypothetical protein